MAIHVVSDNGEAADEQWPFDAEAVARRAYEISLTAAGGTPEMNRARAIREFRSQYPPYPDPQPPLAA